MAITGLTTVSIVCGNGVSVWAQSQEGGLPALAERVRVLENLVTTLGAGLAAEMAARQAADATLQSSINTETTARQAGDATLAAQINTRGKAYSIGSAVLFLPNGDLTVLSSLDLPAGPYFFIGHVNVSNVDHDTG